MSNDGPKKPMNIFDLPATQSGPRDTAMLDAIAEKHGFHAGQATPPDKAAERPKKVQKAKASKEKVRNIGRPRTGRDHRFNQTVHPTFANGLYDYCRRHGIAVNVALERALAALLLSEISDKEKLGDQDSIDQIKADLTAVQKIKSE